MQTIVGELFFISVLSMNFKAVLSSIIKFLLLAALEKNELHFL